MNALFPTSKKIRIAIVGRNIPDLLPLLKKYPCTIVDDLPDLVISYGGDGTLLGAERLFPGIPKMALRDTRNNPKCPLHSEEQLLQALFEGKLDITPIGKLEARLDGVETFPVSLSAVNDIVLSHQSATSAIRYRIWQGEKVLRELVVADALVAATPFGSTGYFQSITHGSFLCGIGLAFSNSLDLSGFLVLPEEAEIRVELLRGPAFVVTDNDPRQFELETGAELTIRMASDKVQVYGVDAFRCSECYDLRRHGITSKGR